MELTDRHLAAYTATEYTNYPAYLSINVRDGEVEISVRSAEAEGYGKIRIPAEHWAGIVQQIQGEKQ